MYNENSTTEDLSSGDNGNRKVATPSNENRKVATLNHFFQKRFRQQKANYGELNNFEK